MEFSWLGTERYYANDSLVFECRSLRPSGVREFTTEGHQIQIEVKTSLKSFGCRAYVDGVLKADDIFAEFNTKIRKRRPWWFNVLLWFAIAFASFGITVLFRT
jgi:hypothetical protein